MKSDSLAPRIVILAVQDFSRIREALNHNKADFLKTDLDTALTFTLLLVKAA